MKGGIEVRLVSPSFEREYGDYVRARADSSFYHSLEWRDVLVGGLGLSPRYLAAIDGGGVAGVLPLCVVESIYFGRRLVSLPYCRHLPVLADGEAAAAALFDRAVSLAGDTRCRTLELRTGGLAPGPAGFARIDHFADFRLDVSGGMDSFLAGGRRMSCRQSVRRAARDGLTVRTGAGLDDYRLLHGLVRETRRRQGAPALPFGFYRGIWQAAMRGAPVRLYLCEKNGEAVAGCVVVRSAGASHMFDAVSTARREVLRARPNHLLVWHAVRDAIADGAHIFDFGPNHRANAKLSAYKMSWGAKEEPVPHYVLALRPGRNDAEDVSQPAYGAARWLIRNAPAAIFSPSWAPKLYLEVL
ncbi:MAG: GNAT family N-acetyltransferase [Deltaproteobacteria bacterium]|nr:GNAT family N-acetyltransferase [Deltaproteobacteria bacterium]